MLKGIITDLDETLISARPAHEGALKNALERNGYPTKVQWIYGLTSEDLARYNFPDMPEQDVIKVAEMKKKKLADYLHLVKPIPHANEFLRFLKSKNLKLCLLTNNTHHEIDNLLETLGWKDYFDAIVGKEDGKPKPSPEPMFVALEKLQLKKEEVLYFGDSDADLESAHAAGIMMMLSQTAHNTAKQTDKAEFVVASLKEAEKKIGGLLQ